VNRCYLADYGYMEDGLPMTPCAGRLIKAHLISRQHLKRYGGNPEDARAVVWACGGVVGVGGHHGALDSSKRLRLRREALPPAVEELAAELGILWLLDRQYGPRRVRVNP
jgi:hypothetical protein